MSLGAAALCWLPPKFATGLTQDGRPAALLVDAAVGSEAPAVTARSAVTEAFGAAVVLSGAAVGAGSAGTDVLGWLWVMKASSLPWFALTCCCDLTIWNESDFPLSTSTSPRRAFRTN